MEAKISELEAEISDLSKRCKHYRESYNALKSKCEEESAARKQSEEPLRRKLEETQLLLTEAHKTLDEYKAQLKTAQQNYASVLAAHNTLQGKVRMMGARYEQSLDGYATTYALIVSERDNLKKVNDALVAELRRRDRMGEDE